nr:DNA-binding protein [Lacisediminimonas profundi]
MMQTLQQLRTAVSTEVAAKALNRQPQTLRKWACLENGPIRPIRINGRLAWPLEELARLLNGGENA